MKLIGNHVSLIPGKSAVRFGIILPEKYRINSLAQVAQVGPSVRKPIVPGAIVITPFMFAEKKNHVIDKESGEFVCPDKQIFAVVIRNKIYPIGNRILVERIVSEQRYGSIVIPEGNKTTDQSLDGIVAQFGIGDKPKSISGLKIGDKVRLAQWEAHMIECGWTGKFYVIVNEDDVISVEK